MKLRKLHIDDYKMFKDFDISFVDENDEPLPIIVLAGVNGSGKTTLLEFILEYESYFTHNFHQIGYKSIEIIDNIGIVYLDYETFKPDAEVYLNNLDFYTNNICYFPSIADDISKIEKEFVKYWYNQVKFHNKRNDEITESLQKFITEVLDGLELDFTYSYIDEDDNIFFQNSNGEKFKISELSTGEQTLLSKVLYLFLKEYKDKVILIDEPELSLHPSWQNKVLKIYENFAKQNSCQIIIATHSPHIIGSAKPEYVRVLKKVEDKIEVFEYDKSYGLEFNKILTDIMGAETRVSDVSERLSKIKQLIINNDFESEEFKTIWYELEELIGEDNIDLRLLKLEIASRKKNVQNK